MTITPQPGYIVDPNNSNGVIRDPNASLDAFGKPVDAVGVQIPSATTPASSAVSSTTPSTPISTIPSSTTQTTTPSSAQTTSPEDQKLISAGLTQAQVDELKKPGGPDPMFFSSVMNSINTKLAVDNTLNTQKSYLLKSIYDTPLTPDQLSQLPPDLQKVVQSGNRDALDLQIQILNDRIAGRANSVSQSINTLTNGYQQFQTQKQAAINDFIRFAQQFPNPGDASKVLEAVYGKDAISKLGINVPELSNLMTTAGVRYGGGQNQGGTSPSGVSYDISTYATDPNYQANINNNLAQIGKITSATDAQAYITAHYPGSPITGDMVMKAATQYGVDPSWVMSILKQETQFGTDKSKGATQNNFGNVGNTDSVMASGASVPMGTPQDGVNAVANWLSNHQKQDAGITAEPPNPATANVVDPILGITPNGLWQSAQEYAFTGKMPALGLGSSAQVRNQRQAIINKAGAIAASMGTTFPALQALYKANSTAASQNVTRLARVESVLTATQMNFPRLETLADTVKSQGINLSESDIQAGQAAVLSKFGSVEAASYVELINTIRSDYSAAQAALAGSRGGQFFAENAQQAIPLGLTSAQYDGIKNTLVYSSTNATTAINQEVNSLLGVNGGLTSPTGSVINSSTSNSVFDSLYTKYGGQ